MDNYDNKFCAILGCARAVFQKSTGFEVEYREHFICNYGPSGNIPKQPVYKVGAPCSFCHEGTSCTLEYPSLCGSMYKLAIYYSIVVLIFWGVPLKHCKKN